MTATITPPVSFAPPASPTRIDIYAPDNTTALAEDVPFIAQSLRIDDGVSIAGVLEVQVGLDAAEHLVPGNLIRASIEDQPVFRAEVEAPIAQQLVHIEGGAREVMTLSCRGHVAQLDLVPIFPYGGVDAKPQGPQRPMSWASPEADTSDLVPATVLFDALSVPWEDPQTDPPWFSPWFPPKGFPDPSAQWIASSTPDPEDGHPPCTRRYIRDVTIGADGWYGLWVAGDDGILALVDGMKIIEGAEAPGDTFILPVQAPIYLTAGVHRLGFELYNYERPAVEAVGTFGGPNIMRLAWALYSLPDGTSTVLTPELLVAHSDEDTLTIDSDDPPPAPTWGKIVQTFHVEAPVGSPAEAWTPAFDETLDSNGNPWTPCGDQSFGTGDDTNLLSVLQQGATSGCIDWRPDPDTGTIYVTNFGEMGVPHVATYTRANGKLLDLKATSIPGRVSGLVVRHSTGLTILDDAATEAEIGVRRRSLALSDLTVEAALAEAQRELDVRKIDRKSYTAAIEVTAGSADAPYGVGGWVPGDSPTFAADEMRAMRVTTTVDIAGRPIFVPELQHRLQGTAERQRIALNRAGATLDATSRAARPLDGIRSGIVAGFVKPLDPLVLNQVMLTPTGMEAVYDKSTTRKWEVSLARVHRIDLTQDVPPQETATVVTIHKLSLSGDEVVATLTLDIGQFHTIAIPEYLHVGLLDNLYFVVDEHDTAVDDPEDPEADARWLKVQIFAIDANPAAVTPRQTEVPW